MAAFHPNLSSASTHYEHSAASLRTQSKAPLHNADPGEARDMFLRRIIEHLKAQHWTAVALDLAIVIVGVFIGTQVSNWNQQRIEKAEAERLLLELRPALQSFTDFHDTAQDYYATTRRYADTAFAGWRGDPGTSPEHFVVAAYQASQIY